VLVVCESLIVLFIVVKLILICMSRPVPAAARSKAWVCALSSAGIAGSNPARDMDTCLLRVLNVVM
jgi:hypothetical protein